MSYVQPPRVVVSHSAPCCSLFSPPLSSPGEASGGIFKALDAGSLLVVEGPPASPGADPSVVPLGPIYEVFGPVARPLYTVRLPVYFGPGVEVEDVEGGSASDWWEGPSSEVRSDERGVSDERSVARVLAALRRLARRFARR